MPYGIGGWERGGCIHSGVGIIRTRYIYQVPKEVQVPRVPVGQSDISGHHIPRGSECFLMTFFVGYPYPVRKP